MSLRIRGQEASLQLVVDGDLKGGSFAKVKSFDLTPEEELTVGDFVGELESEPDIIHHGYAGNFELETVDGKWMTLHQTIVDRERARLPHPAVNLVVTLKYRSLTEPSTTFVVESAVMKMDSLTVAGRKDYVGTKWSFKAKTVAGLL